MKAGVSVNAAVVSVNAAVTLCKSCRKAAHLQLLLGPAIPRMTAIFVLGAVQHVAFCLVALTKVVKDPGKGCQQNNTGWKHSTKAWARM